MITKMFQRADCSIKRYIDFCKQLPRFDELAMEDQIALIKGTWKNIQKDRTYLILAQYKPFNYYHATIMRLLF